jgi:hypothetical protein
MILSTIPSTVGEAEPSSARGEVIEIGTDVQILPAPGVRTGTFLPFMKHQYTYGWWPYTDQGCSGLFVYKSSILQSYGMDSDGQITRISWMDMWGGLTYNHPTAGPGFTPGINSFLNLKIKMGLTTRNDAYYYYSWHYNVAGPVTVYNRPGWTTIGGTHMNWIDFPLDLPFDYVAGYSLTIGFEWDAISGYNMGSTYGGPWGHPSYNRIKGCIMMGYFDPSYTVSLWNPLYKAYSDRGGQTNYDHLPVIQIEGNFGIPATVRMEPQSLNLKSEGNYVSLKVESFPENPEYTPLDVRAGSCEIAEIQCDLKFDTWNENKYITKCDRLLIEDAAGAPGDDTEFDVTGYLNDDTLFKGTAVIDTHMNTP